MEARDSARVLLRLGAAFRTELSEDQLLVWHDTIGRFDVAVAQAAADRCIRTLDRFPAPTQFLACCQEVAREHVRERRAADQPFALEQRDDGTVGCLECGGSLWVEGDRGVRPCSRCDPDLYARWAAGHLASLHDRYACADEECRACRSAHAPVFRTGPTTTAQRQRDKVHQVREALAHVAPSREEQDRGPEHG